MPGAGIGLFQVACRGQGGAAPFSPLSLFSSGEEGAWYDPSDLTTLFQDAAGTVPVTADSQPVRLMLDKSGNGNHATAPSDAARPLYKTAGGLHWLEFDGVDDYLESLGVNATNQSQFLISLAVTSNQARLNSGLLGYTGPTAGAIYIDATPDVLRFFGGTSYSGGAAVIGEQFVGSVVRDSVNDNVRFDGAPVASGAKGTRSGADIRIMTDTGTNYNQGNLYASVVRAGAVDAVDLASLEAYLAAKSGVTLP